MLETLRISAQADYALRAVAEMARAAPDGELLKAEALAAEQDIPVRFLLAILNDLRRAGVVESRRGHGGGYRLARASDQVTLAEVIEAVDTSLSERPWMRHGRSDDSPTRQSVQQVWLTLRANAQQMLESTTIADIVRGNLLTHPTPAVLPPAST